MRVDTIQRRPPIALNLVAVVLLAVPTERVMGQGASTSSGQTSRLDSALVERIEQAVSREMSRQEIPGMSLAVAVDQRLVWSAGFGLADVENYVPAKATTVYRMASISKPVTAVAALQLMEQGKLDLDALVQKYVPEFPPKPWSITSRHLLTHTSGIRHYNGTAERISTRHYSSLKEALDIFKDDELLFQPGTKFSYTSYGYNLLGSVIEGASGQTYLDYVRQNIFQPAGMTRTQADDPYAIIPNRAKFYGRTSAVLRNATLIDSSNKIPGGGLCSTAEDLVRFGVAVKSGRLLKPATVREAFAIARTSDGQKVGEADSQGAFVGHGLGWFIRSDRRGRSVVRYGGTQSGVRSLLYMLPDQEYCVAVMCNLEGVDLDTLADAIAEIVLIAQ